MTESGSGTPGWRGSEVAAWIGLAVALGVLVLHAWHFDFINDDAFISFRYADNLVRHGELTFNVGERVEGYTNFLWTMVMAGVLWVGGDPVPWSKGLGVVLSCGTLGVLFAFGRWWNRSQGGESPVHGAWWSALAPLLLAGNSAFACWSEGGLETALYTFLLTLGWTRYLFEVTTKARVPWSGVAVALAAMTRPEALMVLGVMGLHQLGVQAWVDRRWLPRRETWIWLGGFLVVFLPYLVWRYGYYGYPLPNTFYAKAGEPLWEAGWRYTSQFVTDFHVWVLVPLVLLPWRRVRHEVSLLALAAMIVLPYAVYITRVGGDFMALYRFYVPLLPMLAFVAQEGLANVWGAIAEAIAARSEGRVPPGARVRAVVLGLALLALVGQQNRTLTGEALEVGSKDGIDSIGWLKLFVGQTTAIGVYLRGAWPPETSIATTAAGVIPYYSQMRTLDLLALNDVYTAHNVPAHGKRPGHGKAAPEPYVLQWGPDILIWHPRMSRETPRSSPTEQQYWRARGYKFGHAQVPGLDPPHWSFFEKIADAPPAP